jgi:para-nitrobenzyl esterase
MKLLSAVFAISSFALFSQTRVTTPLGALEGETSSGIRVFRGVPFAQPPTGKLRFAAPLPATKWEGVKEAKRFGPRCMQLPLFGDMNFRSNGMSEDCLYLNIWTPAKDSNEKLPVLVYIFGGGFQAGDGSEPRYDGESMARKGIVAITVNYRLGVFGFFAHPSITASSPHHASGNYGLLDQSAALHWVKDNIAAFGGDPKRITIAGESAGSMSASAQMASPLSRDLIAGVIGESGSALSLTRRTPLKEAEAQGEKFASAIGLKTAEELRSAPAQQIFEASGKPGVARFNAIVDGHFFPELALNIYNAGKQAHIPLLAGWNSQEQSSRFLLGTEQPTVANYKAAVERMYKKQAADILKAYPAEKDADVENAATALASDLFIGLATWKWIDVAAKTGGKPVYRYYYERPRPKMTPEFAGATAGLAGGVTKGPATAAAPPPPKGAVHSAEIEYAMGNLASNKVYAWEPADYAISKTMQEYFANFIKTGNPNGKGLMTWPAVEPDKPAAVMHINVTPRVETERTRERYQIMDRVLP